MKRYIGTKSVEAESMTLGEFYNRKKVNPFGVDIEQHEETEMGYLVKYEDGVENWFAKEAFEDAYRIADTYEDRLLIERQELAERLEKLDMFMKRDDFATIVKDEYQRELLSKQYESMCNYMDALSMRIDALK